MNKYLAIFIITNIYDRNIKEPVCRFIVRDSLFTHRIRDFEVNLTRNHT